MMSLTLPTINNSGFNPYAWPGVNPLSGNREELNFDGTGLGYGGGNYNLNSIFQQNTSFDSSLFGTDFASLSSGSSQVGRGAGAADPTGGPPSVASNLNFTPSALSSSGFRAYRPVVNGQDIKQPEDYSCGDYEGYYTPNSKTPVVTDGSLGDWDGDS